MKPRSIELEPGFHVGSQITPEDIEALKEDGIGMIINNRPDIEVDGQPTSAELETAAEQAGIGYAHVPVARGISPAQVEAEQEAIDKAGDNKIFAFCRTGTRSTLLWALARHEQGAEESDLRAKAELAGYSLDPISHLL